jgi:hydrogenase maturation protease
MRDVNGVPGRRVVLGIGNILNRDEGVGVRALEELRRRSDPVPQLELVDGGVMGLALLPLVEECADLLVLDAIDAGEEPGSLIELGGDDIRLFTGIKMSEHQITFQEVLGLALIRDRLPARLHLLGVQPADVAIGLEMSPAVAATVPALLDRAVAVLGRWGLPTRLAAASAAGGVGTE